MYIHVIGLAYVVYALNLMWVASQLVHPRLRVLNPLTIVVILVVGIEFVDFLLRHNPLVGFRHYILLLVHALAFMGASFLHYGEEDEIERMRLRTTALVSVAGLVLGVGIALLQDTQNPLNQLFHW
jgi:hypothetical protein